MHKWLLFVKAQFRLFVKQAVLRILSPTAVTTRVTALPLPATTHTICFTASAVRLRAIRMKKAGTFSSSVLLNVTIAGTVQLTSTSDSTKRFLKVKQKIKPTGGEIRLSAMV